MSRTLCGNDQETSSTRELKEYSFIVTKDGQKSQANSWFQDSFSSISFREEFNLSSYVELAKAEHGCVVSYRVFNVARYLTRNNRFVCFVSCGEV
jgi:hypothetical protein